MLTKSVQEMPDTIAIAPPINNPRMSTYMKKIHIIFGSDTINITCIIVAIKMLKTATGTLLQYIKSEIYPIKTPPNTYPISNIDTQDAV